MSDVVRIEREGRLALIAIANPPVNAGSQAVRAGLLAAVETLDADPAVAAIAIYGDGKAFVAGSDIREFGKPPAEPLLTAVCSRIEACETPVVAVLHGYALGGGLEIALGCHFRVAVEGLTVGFPEVTLGIIPGAGGTQRAPRLIGMRKAAELASSGRRIGVSEALALGLVDRIVTGEPRALALATAAEAADGALATRRTGGAAVEPDPEGIAEVKAALRATQSHLFSPHKAVESVENSVGPLAEGLAEERRLFAECIASPQRAGLIHAFFAERAVSKIPEAGATPREVARVGVVGAGTMGSGIATALLLAGFPVVLAERDAAGLERGRATIAKNLDGAVARGKMDAAARDAALGERLTLTTDFAAFGEADLIIEAAFEETDVKAAIFRELGRVTRPGAVLATNTSYLDVDAIAAETGRPADVIGLHFFSPAHIMRLLEVVVGRESAPEVVATGFALAKRLRKVAVRSGVCEGFIGNRILSHYRKAAEAMMLEGASPAEIDSAVRAFGFPMGPFEMMDLAGLDIAWAARKRLAATRPAQERYVAVADRICEAGWFGRKTGRGYYVYGNGSPVPNPDALAIIDAERAAAGVTPRAFGEDEIIARTITAMISEAVRVVADGTALRPIDVDAVYLFGYGFPRHKGGPMHTADVIGAEELVRRIETYAADDPHFWRVPPLLRRMRDERRTFGSLND